MGKTLDVLLKNIKKLSGDKSNYWLAKESGVTQATLSRLTNGLINPSLETIEDIAKALKVTPAELLTDDLDLDIPADIIEKLQGQSPQVFDAVRGILNAVKVEKAKKPLLTSRSAKASKSK